MYDVNVIYTGHNDSGNCDIDGLYKIIEGIRPDLIFEELGGSQFNEAYKEQKLYSVETRTITKYLQNYVIVHIPVDTYETPEYSEEKNEFIEKFMYDNDSEYKRILSIQKKCAGAYGYEFLNSYQFIDYTEKRKAQEETMCQNTDNEEYKKNYKDYIKWNNNREYEMIKNIYKYSKENKFSKAIFLIGADHSCTINKKIQDYQEEETKLNWIFNIKDLSHLKYPQS